MESLSSEVVSTLIEQVYHAAIDGSNWSRVVDSLGQMFGGACISLQGHDFSARRHIGVLTAGFAPDAVASFRDHYSAVNPWAYGMSRWPVGPTMMSDGFLSRDDLMRTAFYNEWLLPQQLVSGVGVVAYRSRLRFLALSANLRGRDEERLAAPVAKVFNLLGPHLQQAFKISRLLANAEVGDHHTEVLNQLSVPVLMIDGASRPVYENSPGQRFRSPACGYVDGSSSALRFFDPDADAAFAAAIAAIGTSNYEVLRTGFPISGRPGAPTVHATVVPFVPERELEPRFLGFVYEDRPIALLFISRGEEAGREQHQRLARAGLTSAETNLSVALLAGATLQQYAISRQLSIHTVRNQLRAVFLKTETSRQGELIAKLLS